MISNYVLSKLWTEIKTHSISKNASGPPQPFYIGEQWNGGIMFVGICPGDRITNESETLKNLNDLHWTTDITFNTGNKVYKEVLKRVSAGKFINDIVGEDWSNICYTNLVKNPMKNNMSISQEDIDSWKPILLRQIKFFKPSTIIAFGKIVGKELLDTNTVVNNVYDFNGIKVIQVFHYAYMMKVGIYQSQIERIKTVIKTTKPGLMKYV